MGGLVGLLLSAQLGVSAGPFVQAAPQQRQAGVGAAADRVAVETLVGQMRDELESLKRALDKTSAEVAAQRVLIDDLRRQRNDEHRGPARRGARHGAGAENVDPEPQRFVAAAFRSIVPGTDTAFRIGGQARSTYVSLTPLARIGSSPRRFPSTTHAPATNGG